MSLSTLRPQPPLMTDAPEDGATLGSLPVDGAPLGTEAPRPEDREGAFRALHSPQTSRAQACARSVSSAPFAGAEIMNNNHFSELCIPCMLTIWALPASN